MADCLYNGSWITLRERDLSEVDVEVLLEKRDRH
jgi:hypothetical protein